MTAGRIGVFYRVVRTDPPSRLDFTSNEARGRQPRRPLDARGRRLWQGLSAFDTASGARHAARTTPALGSYVARVEIPPGAQVEVEQTGRFGHYTLWGQPADILRMVVAVEPV
jgi:hypothetical protein